MIAFSLWWGTESPQRPSVDGSFGPTDSWNVCWVVSKDVYWVVERHFRCKMSSKTSLCRFWTTNQPNNVIHPLRCNLCALRWGHRKLLGGQTPKKVGLKAELYFALIWPGGLHCSMELRRRRHVEQGLLCSPFMSCGEESLSRGHKGQVHNTVRWTFCGK